VISRSSYSPNRRERGGTYSQRLRIYAILDHRHAVRQCLAVEVCVLRGEVSEFEKQDRERKAGWWRGGKERRTRRVDISSRMSITSRAARFLSATSAGIADVVSLRAKAAIPPFQLALL
jgi:hypothetical protein